MRKGKSRVILIEGAVTIHIHKGSKVEIYSFTDARMGMRSLVFVGLNCCSSVATLCLTLPGLPVLHHLLEFTQTHVH